MLTMFSDALPSVAPTAEVLKTLTNGLSAYGRLYGLPDSPEQVQGILGTLLRLYQPDRPAIAIDQVAQQVLDGLTPDTLKDAMVDRASSALAKQAHHWQQQVGQQVEGVLAAYMQQHNPNLTLDNLRSVVTAVMPLLDDGPITGSEAMGLVSQLTETFAPSGAIAAVLNSDYLGLAQQLAASLSQKPMAEAVGETLVAYVEKFAPTLTNIGSDLISKALSAVLKNQVDFGFDVDLGVVNEQLLIQQVSFKLNILKQSPPPSKTAQAIAAEVNSAVEAYRRDRDRREGSLDLTAGLVSNDGLSISSGWTSTRPKAQPPAQPPSDPPPSA
jgi:hypothetical protein